MRGLVIDRFQPFHKGHQYRLDHIVAEVDEEEWEPDSGFRPRSRRRGSAASSHEGVTRRSRGLLQLKQSGSSPTRRYGWSGRFDSSARATTTKRQDRELPAPMPECQNCGSFVTEEYVRVFAPEGYNNPRVCPSCEDKLRDGAEIREARSKRQ